MPPKNKGGKKPKEADDAGASSKAQKGAQSINVRHILVGFCMILSQLQRLILQCEKHSRMEEARTKINGGVKFDEVAREYSEDKARQGKFLAR